ncbi:MAG: ankyrin repeat domain-containing protein [Fibrella sp.]|nr:ankyrin repeat domain-containing protein [Armatimonadota bacterium]
MFKTRPFSCVLSGIVIVASLIPALPLHAEGNDTLPEVAARGNAAEVRRLLDAGVSVNLRQARTGWTPLITAVHAGKTEIATLLLDRGADPNVAGVTGYTPLMAATQARNIALMRILLLRGADPDLATSKGLTPLMLAVGNKGDAQAQTKNLECVKLLLRGGADPDKKHVSGATAFSIAAQQQATPIVAYLRRVGAAGSGTTGNAAAVVSDGTITGNVIYRERIAVSPAAFAVVRLLDVKPKVPVVLAQSVAPFAGKQVPVPFSLPYKAATLTARPGGQFALDAWIISGGALRFRTEKPVPTLASGFKSKNVILPLTLAAEDARTRLAAEAIAATDKAIAEAGVSFSGKQTVGDLATSYTASFIGGQLIRILSNSSQGDYGNRTDRFYFNESTDSEGYPILRASYLNARRIARTPAPGNAGQMAIVPGKYEQVVQKIIFNDAGKQVIATKVVDGQNQEVSNPDITAARNFSRIISAEALRAIRNRRGR